VEDDARHHQGHAREVERRRELPQHDHADRGRRRGEQRDEERVGRPGQARHRELVEHVRHHRRGHAHADTGGERDGIGQRMRRSGQADRAHGDEGDRHRSGEAVDAAQVRPARDAMREHDVRREERRVREGEPDARRVALQPQVRQQVHAPGRDGDRGEVARDARTRCGEQDRPEELDRRDRREWQTVDREVEARVHHGEHPAERPDGEPAVAIEPAQAAPRPPPRSEHEGSRRDPQPGDPEHVDPCEEEHGERRAEVVEDGAAGEVRRRRNAVAEKDPAHAGSLPGEPPYGQGHSKALSSAARMTDGLASRMASNRAPFDQTDRRILTELAGDGRVSFAELGRRVNLSAPAVAERVQRLARAGVIVGYRAELDPRALGYPLTALVRVRPAPGRLQRIPELALEVPEVIECHRITGEDCFHLKVALRSIDELGPLLEHFLDYGETTTSIVNASPIPRRDPPLPEV